MDSPRVVTYEPKLFEFLQQGASAFPTGSALRHRSFVNQYFASSDHCKLYLFVDKKDELLACEGIEWMNFEWGGKSHRIGCGSAFYSFKPGSGFYIAVTWLKSCEAGLAFGGTEHGNRVMKSLKWNFSPGLSTYCLNMVYSEPSSRPLHAIAKQLLNSVKLRTSLASLKERLPEDLRNVQVHEQTRYSEEVFNFRSGFAFRFSPALAHLSWRYALDLPITKYRLFTATLGDTPIGYIVIQDMPQGVVVSHSDGTDPKLLAAASVLAVSAVAKDSKDKRQVTLISSHPTMQQVFESVGFRHVPKRDKTFAIGTLRGPLPIPVPVSEWLVNFDWGDRGLRRPFLDESSAVSQQVPQAAMALASAK